MNKNELEKKLLAARNAYYNEEVIMSDDEYDELEGALRAIDPTNYLLIGIGAKISSSSEWEKVIHDVPMQSLNKAQTNEEMSKWARSIGSPSFIISDKCDGTSISLQYQDGRLIRAVTRGDGISGEDIFLNVRLMNGVPNFVKGFSGHIRGEIVLFKETFKKFFSDKKNPRNAANGISKRLFRDHQGRDCEKLTVLSYEVVPKMFLTKHEHFRWLTNNGFSVPNIHLLTWCDGISQIEKVYQQYINGDREELDYEIDGLVIEVNDVQKFDELGQLNHRPKGAIAYKFPQVKKMTKLLDVVWQTGKTGRVTPVGVFEKINLCGADLEKASLHNPEVLFDLKIMIGDFVFVARMNEVIPKIQGLAFAGEERHEIKLPDYCPICNFPLEMNGKFLECHNPLCSAQRSGRTKRWVKNLNIKEWGDKIIDAIYDYGMVKQISDLYRLSEVNLKNVSLDGRIIGRAAHDMMRNLHEVKEVPLNIFVGSLGIPFCSRSTCKMIEDAGYDTLEKMKNISLRELQNINGMGPKKAEFFLEGFREVQDEIADLLQFVKIKERKGNLLGQSFCFSGFRSPSLEAKITELGGNIKTNISRGLSALIVVDVNEGSSKIVKAKSYGIKIISKVDFQEELAIS